MVFNNWLSLIQMKWKQRWPTRDRRQATQEEASTQREAAIVEPMDRATTERAAMEVAATTVGTQESAITVVTLVADTIVFLVVTTVAILEAGTTVYLETYHLLALTLLNPTTILLNSILMGIVWKITTTMAKATANQVTEKAATKCQATGVAATAAQDMVAQHTVLAPTVVRLHMAAQLTALAPTVVRLHMAARLTALVPTVVRLHMAAQLTALVPTVVRLHMAAQLTAAILHMAVLEPTAAILRMAVLEPTAVVPTQLIVLLTQVLQLIADLLHTEVPVPTAAALLTVKALSIALPIPAPLHTVAQLLMALLHMLVPNMEALMASEVLNPNPGMGIIKVVLFENKEAHIIAKCVLYE